MQAEWRDGGLARLWFVDEGPCEAPRTAAESELVRQLSEYFAGQRREFDVPLNFNGTDFQKRVWNALLALPYGETISYAELSLRLGDLKAIRAVGRANGANPICILVPCHRIIGSDGSLTGYAFGVERKRRLLEIEGVQNFSAEQIQMFPK